MPFVLFDLLVLFFYSVLSYCHSRELFIFSSLSFSVYLLIQAQREILSHPLFFTISCCLVTVTCARWFYFPPSLLCLSPPVVSRCCLGYCHLCWLYILPLSQICGSTDAVSVFLFFSVSYLRLCLAVSSATVTSVNCGFLSLSLSLLSLSVAVSPRPLSFLLTLAFCFCLRLRCSYLFLYLFGHCHLC